MESRVLQVVGERGKLVLRSDGAVLRPALGIANAVAFTLGLTGRHSLVLLIVLAHICLGQPAPRLVFESSRSEQLPSLNVQPRAQTGPWLLGTEFNDSDQPELIRIDVSGQRESFLARVPGVATFLATTAPTR